MTEEKSGQTQENKKSEKKIFSLKRFLILFVIVFCAYFGLRHFEIKQAQKLGAVNDAAKHTNIESEIFDLAEDYKNGHDHTDSEIALSAMQEKGAQFIYKMLLANQQQISDLKQQTEVLKAEFTKYKNHEKLSKMVLAYVAFRQDLYSGVAYEDALKNFEMLSISDQNLQDKITKLRTVLKDFSPSKEISAQFDDLIPEIISAKNVNDNGSFFSKVRQNISKLVIIRRIDGKNPEDVDGIVARVEKNLTEQNYQKALENMLLLDQKYHGIIARFLDKLNAVAEVKKIDNEIFSYLKSLN